MSHTRRIHSRVYEIANKIAMALPSPKPGIHFHGITFPNACASASIKFGYNEDEAQYTGKFVFPAALLDFPAPVVDKIISETASTHLVHRLELSRSYSATEAVRSTPACYQTIVCPKCGLKYIIEPTTGAVECACGRIWVLPSE